MKTTELEKIIERCIEIEEDCELPDPFEFCDLKGAIGELKELKRKQAVKNSALFKKDLMISIKSGIETDYVYDGSVEVPVKSFDAEHSLKMVMAVINKYL